MDDIKVKPADNDGVFFDLENDSQATYNNFGIAASAQAPNKYVKHILNLALKNEDFKFQYVANRYNEKKALLNAVENEFIICLDEGNSLFQLTKKGFLATRFR